MDHIKEIIKIKPPLTVNSNKKYISTVNSNTVTEKFKKFIEDNRLEAENIAQILADNLNDKKSHAYYLILAKENRGDRLLEALSYVRDASRRNKIRTTKPIYFLGILKKWKFKTKFRGPMVN